MPIHDSDLNNKRKLDMSDNRLPAKAVSKAWSIEAPGTLVKRILGIDLSKEKISLSEDNVVMIGDLKINLYVEKAYNALLDKLKHYKIELEKMDKLLSEPMTKENANKREAYQQQKNSLIDRMHEWSKTYQPENVSKATQKNVKKQLQGLKENIQEFDKFKEKDPLNAAMQLKKIKVQMLDMSKDLKNYVVVSLLDMKDLTAFSQVISLLLFDVYDYLAIHSRDDKIQDVSIERANSPARESAYIKYLNFQLNLAIDLSRPADDKIPSLNKIDQYLAYLMVKDNDAPDVIIARLSRQSLVLGKPNPILFETTDHVLSGYKARNAIFQVIKNRSNDFSLVQILKIFSKIKRSGLNMNDVRTRVFQVKDVGAHILRDKISEIKNKSEAYIKLLQEINDKLLLENDKLKRDELLSKHQSLVNDYMKYKNDFTQALKEKHERGDGIREPSLQYFAFKNRETHILTELNKYFQDNDKNPNFKPADYRVIKNSEENRQVKDVNNPNIDRKHAQEQPAQIPQNGSFTSNPLASLERLSSALQKKPDPAISATVQTTRPSFLMQNTLHKAVTMSQQSVSRSALITYDDYRKGCIAAEKNWFTHKTKGDPMYQEVKLVQGFTANQNTDKVIICSKSNGSIPPHKMISKFIPKSTQASATDKNTRIDPHMKGEVEITIDPNPDDKILYQAFLFHTSVQKLKLEPGCNAKTILNLVNAAKNAGWHIEVIEARQEDAWVQDLSSSKQNKLGLTQIDYQNIVDFTARSQLAKRMGCSERQAKIYQDLIEQSIAKPANRNHKGLGQGNKA